MFIRINNRRIKSQSIGEFEVKGKSPSSLKWYIDIKISGKVVMFAFDDEPRMREVEEYLDKVLDVKAV